MKHTYRTGDFIRDINLSRSLVLRDCTEHSGFPVTEKTLCPECRLRYEEAWVYPILWDIWDRTIITTEEYYNLTCKDYEPAICEDCYEKENDDWRFC